MTTATVRIRSQTLAKLQQLSATSGESMSIVLDRAVDLLYRKEFLRGLAEDYARLKVNQLNRAEDSKERRLWDRTLADGLEDV